MKNFKLILNLILVVSSFMFFQCTTDTLIGPAGADGQDGVNGLDGTDGLAGTDGLDGADVAVCISCHSNTHRDPIRASFLIGKHFLGTHTGGNYGSREDCSRCHSNEGYIDLLTKGFVQPGGYYGIGQAQYSINDNGTPLDPTDDFPNLEDDPDSPTFGLPIIENENFENASKMNCTTCHGQHKSFDFANDGNDKALRQGFKPVTLFADPSITIDLGLSNTCVNCHQPRDSYTVPTGTDDYTVTSSRFGPHHGPQSTMLWGVMGAEIAGSLPYAAPGSTKHAEAACITCHMGATTDGSDGAHSWIPTANACITCHGSEPEGIGSFDADMQILLNKLVALGAMTTSGSAKTGTWPANVAKAMWNYKTLQEDLSKGIHNPAYTRALLRNSIDAL